jgi:hypothetical protein
MTANNSSASSTIVELNVGGVFYSTSVATLTSEPGSKLAKMFDSSKLMKDEELTLKDSKGKYFIDRDGVLFRYILDYLRNKKLVLPENFQETKRLVIEADFYELPSLVSSLRVTTVALPEVKSNHVPTSTTVTTEENCSIQQKANNSDINPHPKLSNRFSFPASSHSPTSPRPCASDLTGLTGAAGTIVIGYRGTFAFGKDGLSDVKFRKLTRILVHGKVILAREVFGDTLNESRDPDRGGTNDRYTSRYFLKHSSIEQAFDALLDAGFYLGGCCGTGTATASSGPDLKPGMDTEENRWNHYNEFVFIRHQ